MAGREEKEKDGKKHHNNDHDNCENHLIPSSSFSSASPSSSSSINILSLIDSFIEQIFHMRRTLDVISISSIILASIAITLSIFLLRNPTFFAVLEIENEFGLVLGILLSGMIIISAVWIIAGIKQHRSISSWSKRYSDYTRHRKV